MQNQLQNEEMPAYSAAALSVQAAEVTNEVMEETQTTQTLAERRAEFQRRRRRYKVRLTRFIFGIFGAIGIPVALLPLLMNVFHTDARVLPFLLIASFLFPLLAFMVFSMRRKPLFDADELARLGGVNAIGEMLQMRNEAVSQRDGQAIMDALTRLLPQLKLSDASLLSRVDRTLLHQNLASFALPVKRSPQTYAFGEAILQALEQVGDATSLPIVGRLARMQARTPAQERLKAAAAQYLPALEANQGRMDATQTLLRASMPQAAAPDTLLRPASYTPLADTKSLLRAAPPDDQPPR